MLLLTLLLSCGPSTVQLAPDGAGGEDSAAGSTPVDTGQTTQTGDTGQTTQTGDTGTPPPPPPILADYDGEPREPELREDGLRHVDSPALVDQLLTLNANTYAFLIYHSPSDWADLAEYLALAEPKGIDTWVYLVPPTELPVDYPPFQGDYVAWAEAIGQLAALHPSITAIAMDDFNSDTDTFTGDYLCEMMAAAHASAPGLKFYAVDYYPYVLVDMAAEASRRCIDGVIFPYMDLDSNASMREQIDAIAAMREGVQDAMQITYAWNHPSVAGDHGRYTATCAPGELSFAYLDDYPWDSTYGYHFLRVREDEVLRFEEDVSGAESAETTTLALDGGEVSISLEDDLGVYNYGIQVNLADFDAPSCGEWTWEATSDGFTGAFADVEGWTDMELIPMVYAAATSWHPVEPGTEVIAEAVQIALSAWTDGAASGVITYSLDMSEGSEEAGAVGAIYGACATP